MHVLTQSDRCYWINVASLVCGFVGNFFLLMNFTQKVRYIVALPVTIILWYIATGLVSNPPPLSIFDIGNPITPLLCPQVCTPDKCSQLSRVFVQLLQSLTKCH